ncbi:diguanylate cyclase, partial [Pseudomonas sp. PA-6-1H]
LPTTNTDGALGVLDELRASLAESSAQYGEAKISVRISIGVCCVVPNEDDTTAAALAKADAALYDAKASGRNTLKLVQSYPQQNEAPLML